MDAFVQTEQLHLCKWKRYDGQGHVLFTIFFIRTSVRKHIAFLLLWFRTNTSKFIRTNSFILLCVHPKAPFTRYNLLSNRFDNQLNVCTIQPVVKPVVKPVSQPVVSCIQAFNRLSVWQPAVSCIQPVVKPIGQPGSFNPVERTVAVRSTRLSNRVCQTGYTTGLTTGCIV